MAKNITPSIAKIINKYLKISKPTCQLCFTLFCLLMLSANKPVAAMKLMQNNNQLSDNNYHNKNLKKSTVIKKYSKSPHNKNSNFVNKNNKLLQNLKKNHQVNAQIKDLIWGFSAKLPVYGSAPKQLLNNHGYPITEKSTVSLHLLFKQNITSSVFETNDNVYFLFISNIKDLRPADNHELSENVRKAFDVINLRLISHGIKASVIPLQPQANQTKIYGFFINKNSLNSASIKGEKKYWHLTLNKYPHAQKKHLRNNQTHHEYQHQRNHPNEKSNDSNQYNENGFNHFDISNSHIVIRKSPRKPLKFFRPKSQTPIWISPEQANNRIFIQPNQSPSNTSASFKSPKSHLGIVIKITSPNVSNFNFWHHQTNNQNPTAEKINYWVIQNSLLFSENSNRFNPYKNQKTESLVSTLNLLYKFLAPDNKNKKAENVYKIFLSKAKNNYLQLTLSFGLQKNFIEILINNLNKFNSPKHKIVANLLKKQRYLVLLNFLNEKSATNPTNTLAKGYSHTKKTTKIISPTITEKQGFLILSHFVSAILTNNYNKAKQLIFNYPWLQLSWLSTLAKNSQIANIAHEKNPEDAILKESHFQINDISSYQNFFSPAYLGKTFGNFLNINVSMFDIFNQLHIFELAEKQLRILEKYKNQGLLTKKTFKIYEHTFNFHKIAEKIKKIKNQNITLQQNRNQQQNSTINNISNISELESAKVKNKNKIKKISAKLTKIISDTILISKTGNIKQKLEAQYFLNASIFENPLIETIIGSNISSNLGIIKYYNKKEENLTFLRNNLISFRKTTSESNKRLDKILSILIKSQLKNNKLNAAIINFRHLQLYQAENNIGFSIFKSIQNKIFAKINSNIISLLQERFEEKKNKILLHREFKQKLDHESKAILTTKFLSNNVENAGNLILANIQKLHSEKIEFDQNIIISHPDMLDKIIETTLLLTNYPEFIIERNNSIVAIFLLIHHLMILNIEESANNILFSILEHKELNYFQNQLKNIITSWAAKNLKFEEPLIIISKILLNSKLDLIQQGAAKVPQHVSDIKCSLATLDINLSARQSNKELIQKYENKKNLIKKKQPIPKDKVATFNEECNYKINSAELFETQFNIYFYNNNAKKMVDLLWSNIIWRQNTNINYIISKNPDFYVLSLLTALINIEDYKRLKILHAKYSKLKSKNKSFALKEQLDKMYKIMPKALYK